MVSYQDLRGKEVDKNLFVLYYTDNFNAWTSETGGKIRVTGDCNCFCDRQIVYIGARSFGNGISCHETIIFIVPVNMPNHARTEPMFVFMLKRVHGVFAWFISSTTL